MTKYLYKMLTGDVAERVRGMVRQVCEMFEIRIVSGVVSKDHVHILVSAPPNMGFRGRTPKSVRSELSHFQEVLF